MTGGLLRSGKPLTTGADDVLSIPPTDIIGCKLNVHCPFTDVINGTVCTLVGTCPTVGTHIVFVVFDATVGVVIVFERDDVRAPGISGVVIVLTMLLELLVFVGA